tara:strand:- start:3277 stop:3510 length:234 start_codon:yes stop_codon:yes gene_type:complete
MEQTHTMPDGTVMPGASHSPTEMSNMPPAPSNVLGQAQPVFNAQAQQNALGIFGTQENMQNSVNAAPMFKKIMPQNK